MFILPLMIFIHRFIISTPVIECIIIIVIIIIIILMCS